MSLSIIEQCSHERTTYMGTFELCPDCGSIFRLTLVESGGDVDLVRGTEVVLGRAVIMELAKAVIAENKILEAAHQIMGCD